MEVKASLKFVRIGVLKARPLAAKLRGLDINSAMKVLSFTDKKAARLMKKLFESAIANAENKKTIDVDNLYVKELMVDQGPQMKRFMPRAQGRAFPVRKRMSHINLTLAEK